MWHLNSYCTSRNGVKQRRKIDYRKSVINSVETTLCFFIVCKRDGFRALIVINGFGEFLRAVVFRIKWVLSTYVKKTIIDYLTRKWNIGEKVRYVFFIEITCSILPKCWYFFGPGPLLDHLNFTPDVKMVTIS